MTNEGLQHKVDKILSDDKLSGVGRTAEIINLINILKSDIAQAIKDSAQSGGGVDFIDVPKAIEIVTNGGIPTRRELLELAQEFMNNGQIEKANALMEKILDKKAF